MCNKLMCFLSIFLACSLGDSLQSTEPGEAYPDKKIHDVEKTALKKEDLKEELSQTSHSVKINGVDFPYVATAGTMLLKNEEDNAKASFFYVAYTKDSKDTDENSRGRPITFCFNGGPGSSSIWLHIGVWGPKRISLDDLGYSMPPYHLVDNEYSILDTTDLVFIDPVSTGYSRPAPGENAKQFHGVEEDIRYVAEFIRLYVTRNGRWDSPKFLAGESYGTTRAAGLSSYLHDEFNMYVNGIVLVSSVLNFQGIDFDEGNDLPYIMFLPSYAASAWYHKKLSPELQADLNKTLKEVKAFAHNEYSLALMKGDLLTDVERKVIVEKLSQYTGLSSSYIGRNNLRVNIYQFATELFKEEKRLLGRFDSRFLGINNEHFGCVYEYDPSAEAVFGGFTAAFNQYMRKDLKVEKDQQYVIIGDVSPWNYGKATNQYLSVSNDLRKVMTKNPRLTVFVANGYFDLATPFAATEYTFNHLGLDPSIKNNVSMGYYEAGHMMYIHKPSLIKMRQDVTNYMERTLKGS